MTQQEQLELGFNGGQTTELRGRQTRTGRAQWWFGQMRRVVGQAMDWSPAPAPRPEQTWMLEARKLNHA